MPSQSASLEEPVRIILPASQPPSLESTATIAAHRCWLDCRSTCAQWAFRRGTPWGVGSAHIFRSPQALAPTLHAAAPSSLLLPDYYPVTSGQDCTHRARSVQEQLVTAMLSQLRPAQSLVLQTQRSKPDAHLRCNGEVSRHALHTQQHCTPCAAAAAAGAPAAASRAIWGHLAPLWSRNHLMYPMLCGSPT